MTNISASLIQCFFRLLFWCIITEKMRMLVMKPLFQGNVWQENKAFVQVFISYNSLETSFICAIFFTFIRKITFLSFCCFEISDVICDNDRIHYIGFHSKVSLPQNTYFLNPWKWFWEGLVNSVHDCLTVHFLALCNYCTYSAVVLQPWFQN